MHRAWLRSVTMPVALLACLLAVSAVAVAFPTAAHAFHSGAQFDDLPGKGGGGGVFYTGAASDKGWTCTACHIGSQGQISIGLAAVPSALFQSGAYTPGQAYKLTVSLRGEHLGQSSGRSNFNGFALTVRDAQSRVVGSISGYAPEDFYQANAATIATAGKVVGTTSWTFTYTAPAAGTGAITFYLAMVDGNGANSSANATLTDPFGDDVAVGQVTLKDSSVSALLPATPQVIRTAEYTEDKRGLRIGPTLLNRLALSLGEKFDETYPCSPWSIFVGSAPCLRAPAGLQRHPERRHSLSRGRHLHG